MNLIGCTTSRSPLAAAILRWGVGAVLLLTVLSGAAEPDIRRDLTVMAIEKVMPSVVNIQTKTLVERHGFYEDLLREFYGPYYRRRPADEQFSLGSGVIIDEAGYVLTNFHVVQRANEITVKLADGRVYTADPVVSASLTDVALLKLRSKPGEKFPAAAFAEDDDLLLGETVVALGIPFGLGGSVSRGILSSKTRRPPAEGEPLDVADWLQTDAAINPGNSGGPLINLRGEIIGINVAVYREGQGIGFAIPIKRVREALSRAFTPEALKQIWFGACVGPGRLPLRVTSVEPGSPAAKAGVKVGDQIVAVNEHEPRSFVDFNNHLVDLGTATPIRLTIQRGNQRNTLVVQQTLESSFYNEGLVRQKTGATVQSLTPELAQSLGLSSANGLVITDVERGSPAATSGLRRDVRLLAVDGYAINDVLGLAKFLSRKKKGDTVVFSVAVERAYGDFIQRRTGDIQLQVR